MRSMFLGLIVAALVSGCGPKGPDRAESDNVVAEADDPGALWPLALQHCVRSPNCDPLEDFGQGEGQASGVVEQTAYFVESADVVKEGGQDYGASITLSLYGPRGQGGKAGRPLTIDEAPDDLRATNARRSTLSIEYRTPGGGAPEPYFLTIHSAQVALTVPDIAKAKTRDGIKTATEDFLQHMTWPNGEGGVKIEIAGKAGALFGGYSWGLAGQGDPLAIGDEDAVKRGFEPWFFYAPQNIRDEPLPNLIKAIEDGETLSLKITVPDGGVVLQDGIYTGGFKDALKEATAALADPELKKTIEERCKPFAGKDDAFWKSAKVSAAQKVCDPRTEQQKRLNQ